MKVAAIDMGTNTTLMLLADVEGGRIQKVLSDHSTITRLGQGVDANGRLHPEALQRMDQCLYQYRQIIDENQVSEVVAVATSAARDAENKDDLFEITSRYNIPVKVISGDKEAEITFAGSTFDIEDKQGLVVIDVGGGSTEIVGLSEGLAKGHSLNVGSVRLTEKFISQHPVSSEEVLTMKNFLMSELENKKSLLPQLEELQAAVAVAGTPTTLAMVMQKSEFIENKIHRFQISTKDLSAWAEKLAKMSIDERKQLEGMPPKRADVIVAGTFILSSVLEFLKIDHLTVSTKGVRYGLALMYDQI